MEGINLSMGARTGISWTDSTWNPVYGCSEVSPGCDNCYARRDMQRFGKPWEITRAGKDTFYAPYAMKQPRRIFVCSWSDLFHPHIPEEWLQEIWDIMLAAPQHTYQVLTKRPGRMVWWAKRHGWPDHIWAGTSVESAKYLPRLDVLARVRAKVRFVSCEPMLGPLDLRRWLSPWWRCTICGRSFPDDEGCSHDTEEFGSVESADGVGAILSWVIAGGESGPDGLRRPMDTAWVEDIVGQCREARVPVFVKQDSGRLPGLQGRIPDHLWALKETP